MKRLVYTSTSSGNSQKTTRQLVRDFCATMGFNREPGFIDPTRYGYRLSWKFTSFEQEEISKEIKDKLGIDVHFTNKNNGYIVIPYGELERVFGSADNYAVQVLVNSVPVGFIQNSSVLCMHNNDWLGIVKNLKSARTFPRLEVVQEFIENNRETDSFVVKSNRNPFYVYRHNNKTGMWDYIEIEHSSSHQENVLSVDNDITLREFIC